jgi:thiamine pyrophosphokinase
VGLYHPILTRLRSQNPRSFDVVLNAELIPLEALRRYQMVHSHIALITRGNLAPSEKLLLRIQSYPYIVAVNGGLTHCFNQGIKPNLIMGDFDTASDDAMLAFSKIPKRQFRQDTAQTDLEIALQEIYHEGCQEITIFGGISERIDHSLANLLLLARYPGILYLETEQELFFVIKDREELDCFPSQRISLIPLNGSVTGVTTQGLKWDMRNATLDKYLMSLSNQAVGNKVTIQVKQGDLLCCAQVHN